jgi:hypothetical protein
MVASNILGSTFLNWRNFNLLALRSFGKFVDPWNTYRIGVENFLGSNDTENREAGRVEMRKRFVMYSR